MLTYDYRGIAIEVVCEFRASTIPGNRQAHTRMDRITQVYVTFFDLFAIEDGNLGDLAFTKACTQYFLQSYWRHRSSSRIDFGKKLTRDAVDGNIHSLSFTARQKNNRHYLQVALQVGERLVAETYLDVHEAIMFDTALSKALNLCAPKPFLPSESLY